MEVIRSEALSTRGMTSSARLVFSPESKKKTNIKLFNHLLAIHSSIHPPNLPPSPSFVGYKMLLNINIFH